jgi:hypothetical protein
LKLSPPALRLILSSSWTNIACHELLERPLLIHRVIIHLKCVKLLRKRVEE